MFTKQETPSLPPEKHIGSSSIITVKPNSCFYFPVNTACIVPRGLSLNSSCNHNTIRWETTVKRGGGVGNKKKKKKLKSPPQMKLAPRGKDSALACTSAGCGEIWLLIQGLSTGKQQQLLWQADRQLCNYQWEEPDSSSSLNTCLPHSINSTLQPEPARQRLLFHTSTYFALCGTDPTPASLNFKSFLFSVITPNDVILSKTPGMCMLPKKYLAKQCLMAEIILRGFKWGTWMLVEGRNLS